MLTLSRRVGEKIMIGHDIILTVVRIERGQVRIGIEAPRETPIHRYPYTRLADQQMENGNASSQER